MVEQMEKEGFGSCRNYGECEAQCPKEISIKFIGQLNREYLNASLREPLNRRGKMAPQLADSERVSKFDHSYI